MFNLHRIFLTIFSSFIFVNFPLYAADPFDGLIQFFGEPIYQKDMIIKAFEHTNHNNPLSPIKQHPFVSSFIPGQTIKNFPILGPNEKIIWAAILDDDLNNPYGFKLKFAVEKKVGEYISPRSGTIYDVTWGHPTIIRPDEGALLGGDLIYHGRTLELNNASGRISAHPSRGAAGLEVAAEALRRCIQENRRFDCVETRFIQGLTYGIMSNAGASTEVPHSVIHKAFDYSKEFGRAGAGIARRSGMLSQIVLPEGAEVAPGAALAARAAGHYLWTQGAAAFAGATGLSLGGTMLTSGVVIGGAGAAAVTLRHRGQLDQAALEAEWTVGTGGYLPYNTNQHVLERMRPGNVDAIKLMHKDRHIYEGSYEWRELMRTR